ncbi:hypothetical protein Trydic_g18681 [Trypoxylus dichotomus]
MNLLGFFCLQLLITTCALTYSFASSDKQSKSPPDEKAMERFWSKNVLRPGKKRSDILPFPVSFLVSPDVPEEFNELLRRETRGNSNHMRYGRGNPNFLRYGRNSNDYKENPASTKADNFARRYNNLFMRYGRDGNNDFIRYSCLDDPEDFSEDYDNENQKIPAGITAE